MDVEQLIEMIAAGEISVEEAADELYELMGLVQKAKDWMGKSPSKYGTTPVRGKAPKMTLKQSKQQDIKKSYQSRVKGMGQKIAYQV